MEKLEICQRNGKIKNLHLNIAKRDILLDKLAYGKYWGKLRPYFSKLVACCSRK